jgi:hypothetical protein
MTDSPSQPNQAPRPPVHKPSPGVIKVILILALLPFLGFGAFMAWKILPTLNANNYKVGILFLLFVLFIVIWPFAALYRGFQKAKRQTESAPQNTEPPDQPEG